MPETAASSASPAPPIGADDRSALLEALLVVVAVLYVLDLALPWSRLCLTLVPLNVSFCSNVLGWRGLGGLGGLFALLVIALWGFSLSARTRPMVRPALHRMTRRLLALTILGLTIGELVMDRVILAFGGWIGLALGVALLVLAIVAPTPGEGEPT
jgi:hypothetical protein